MMHRAHRGFSLLEVLLATTILLGAIVVLGELVRIGLKSAAGTRDLATAQRLCATKLAEVVAGIQPLETVREAPLRDQSGWIWSLEVRPLAQPGLSSVKVTVAQNLDERMQPLSYALARWVYRDASATGLNSPGEFPSPLGDSIPSGSAP